MNINSYNYIGQVASKLGASFLWRNTFKHHLHIKHHMMKEKLFPVQKCSIIPDQLKWLLKEAPAFPLHGTQIKIITKPKEFYEELVNRASTSSKRILFTSLYLGTGNLEKKLVSVVDDRLSSCKSLKVRWLLDHTRGSRGDISSRTILLPLISKNPFSCQVSLYHTPELRGLLRQVVPQRWNETIGLQHMKIYIFDNSLILSGANLSNDYFTNRQDRYVIFEDCKELVDFYEKIVETISHFSFQLLPNNTTTIQPLSGINPLEGDKKLYCGIVNHTISNIWEEECHASNHRVRQLEHVLSESPSVENAQPDTLVFPTLQMGPFNIKYDNVITKKLFNNAESKSFIKLASGYFNLTEEYMKCILNSSLAKFDILCAHPKANGFLGAKGFAGAIPSAYTQLAKQFYNRVLNTEQTERINLFEYQRNGWTFHGKGLWYYTSSNSKPVLTMIGSPNFGYRSMFRDLESQAIIITQNKYLQRELEKEQQNLYSPSNQVTKSTYKDESRAVPLWVRFVMPIIKAFF